MLTATQIAAFVGVGLAGTAYIPQIWHLVRAHCSAGISRFAFCLWLGASLLITTHAIATQAAVFVVLGGVQIAATTVILLFATKYASSYCGGHEPGTLGPGAETKPRVIGEAPRVAVR
ncbi:MAG TPA: PQ-loop repeat-containing protein [Actinomycetota bacterium]|nr:PQ-loop repeat-containing protein [Actinomycetota bacterium]